MQNSLRVAFVLAAWLAVTAARAAPTMPGSTWSAYPAFASPPIGESCHLGFASAGSPVIITRVSALLQHGGIEAADELIDINGVSIADQAALATLLSGLAPDDRVSVRVSRGAAVLRISVTCTNAYDVLLPRYEALRSAADGRWDDCVRHTLAEEIHWGGISSQSAGLRLWCHQGKMAAQGAPDPRVPQGGVSRIGARFVFDYLDALLDEVQHVPGGIDDARLHVSDGIRLLDDHGHWRLARELSRKLESIDGDLLTAGRLPGASARN